MPALAAPSASAMPLLFAHYVTGTVPQNTWDAFSVAFDEATASDDERAAFAHFYLEMVTDGDEIKLPRPSELEDVLAAIHA